MVAGKLYLQPPYGELAQLARALAWHARGHRFDSVILHHTKSLSGDFFHFQPFSFYTVIPA